MKLKSKILILLMIFALIIPYTVIAAETNVPTNNDEKTEISLDVNHRVLDQLFNENDYTPKEKYVSARLNMRVIPNIKSKVKSILNINEKVNVVAEYKGWSRIIVQNENGDEEEYYVWSEYLSDEKTETTTNQSNSSISGNTYLGNFKLTAYCNCSSCCGQWAGGNTASGTNPVAGRTVAMGGVDFGTKLLINGNVYVVEDRGTPYGHVDIYFNSHSEAVQFGLQYADVYRVESHVETH